MKKWHAGAITAAMACLVVTVWLVWMPDAATLASRWVLGRQPQAHPELRDDATEPGPSRVPDRQSVPGTEERSSGSTVIGSEQEFADYVAWLRSLGHDELLRLTNAEFGFEDSEIVETLQQLRGPWVVSALGDLAVAETDPLLRAILVKGLVGSIDLERYDDPHLVPVLDKLIGTLGHASEDPYRVAQNLATAAYGACARGGQDYVFLMSGHLLTSDNGALLTHGYLYMGKLTGGEATLKQMLAAHASPEGRLGALEGLRQCGTDGRIPPDEITTLGLAALASETNERNRLLLYEMMTSAGGDEALTAVEQILRSGQVTEIEQTVGFLAVHMESGRARALFQDLLREHELDGESKQALYNAMGLLEGDESTDLLLGLARDDELDGAERLAGLRGLWNRPVDERLTGELRDVFDTAGDSALRTEALRMLVYGESQGRGIDLRELAVLDEDPLVRAEAVQMAAMRSTENTRAWLEERLFQDDSIDVKAAALGALVYQAHYTGDGDAVLGYLERARKFTRDEEALAMIAEGERMVREYDPRNLDLRLAEEAEFLGTIARYTEGPAARQFQRQAKQLGQIVASLRATRTTRAAQRPAR
jgi:hypothetical protein